MAGVAPKAIKTLTGVAPSAAAESYSPPAEPLDPAVIAQCILQLQNTVNALIVRFNAHQHAALNAAPPAGFQHDGTAQSASNLFTAS